MKNIKDTINETTLDSFDVSEFVVYVTDRKGTHSMGGYSTFARADAEATKISAMRPKDIVSVKASIASYADGKRYK